LVFHRCGANYWAPGRLFTDGGSVRIAGRRRAEANGVDRRDHHRPRTLYIGANFGRQGNLTHRSPYALGPSPSAVLRPCDPKASRIWPRGARSFVRGFATTDSHWAASPVKMISSGPLARGGIRYEREPDLNGLPSSGMDGGPVGRGLWGPGGEISSTILDIVYSLFASPLGGGDVGDRPSAPGPLRVAAEGPRRGHGTNGNDRPDPIRNQHAPWTSCLTTTNNRAC